MVADFRVGAAIEVGGRRVPVARVVAPNAGPMTGPGTNTYLVGSDELALIDPGPLDDAHLASIEAAIGGRRLRWVLVTHTHADHSPAATPMARRTGAELVGIRPPASGRHDRSFVPDREYRHGELLAGGEYTLELIHTPGHVSNHFCFLLQEEGMLFTGDHILQGTTSVILPPDGDMADYMASLRHLASLQLASLAPGHGDIIREPRGAIEHLIAHRRKREAKVLEALAELGASPVDRLTLRVYDDVAPHLIPWARLTLEAHLIKLRKEGRVVQAGADWVLA